MIQQNGRQAILFSGIIFFLFFCGFKGWCQVTGITPDHVYLDNIKTVTFTLKGAPLTYPIISLNAPDQVELGFDDLDGDVKDYEYTLVLCNANWEPADINSFDYLKGFSSNRINQYQFSTIPIQHYTHYTLDLPNSNISPIRSGNYLLKVYLNGDTSQLAFTRRLLVVDNKVGLYGKIQQPVNPRLFLSDQKVNFTLTTNSLDVSDPFSQIKVFILQNDRWDNAVHGIRPTFIKGDELDYNTENDCVFPGMKEWRYIDLRSFRLQTERVQSAEYFKTSTVIQVRPDLDRENMAYQYIPDIDGAFIPELLDPNYNPANEGDYATVHFIFPVKSPFAGSDLYLFGALTNYECDSSNRMVYDANQQAYVGSLYLKEGFYNYIYGTIDRGTNLLDTENTEGNWWNTENNYTILVYYRSIGGRADQLVGALTLNSMQNR
ncbi:MAG: type IX secretion system plug protein [Chitinophagaceae bacterium]